MRKLILSDPIKSTIVQIPIKDLLYSYCSKSAHCWNWFGLKDKDGYGVLCHDGLHSRAHRLSWEINNGVIPKGMMICHSCDNTSCINPDHLFLGTPLDNMNDKKNKGREFYAKGKDAGPSVLTEEQALIIKACPIKRNSTTILSKKFNITRQAVSFIRKGINWKYLPEPTEEHKQKAIEIINK